MQHTEKYRFDLIERDDVFSPDALNGNMEKVERALERETGARQAADAAEAQARAGADAALDRRLQVVEARHIAYGTYRPQSGGLDITLGFQPAIVLIQAFETFLAGALTLDVKSSRGHITENGFHINPATSSGTITCGGYTFAYFAFA